MARSSKKGPFVDEKLMKKVAKLSQGDTAVVKTWARSSEIAPEMIGRILGVHNGKDFIQVRVTEEMVGHKLGEFSPTKKFIRHGGKLAKEADRKAATAKK